MGRGLQGDAPWTPPISFRAMATPPTPEEQEDLLIIARELLRAVPSFLPERRLWAEEKLADVERQLDGREGPPAGSARRKKIEETISKVRGALTTT